MGSAKTGGVPGTAPARCRGPVGRRILTADDMRGVPVPGASPVARGGRTCRDRAHRPVPPVAQLGRPREIACDSGPIRQPEDLPETVRSCRHASCAVGNAGRP